MGNLRLYVVDGKKKRRIKCLSPFRGNMTDSRQAHVNKSSFNERYWALLGCIKNIATVSAQLQQQEAELPKRWYPEAGQGIVTKREGQGVLQSTWGQRSFLTSCAFCGLHWPSARARQQQGGGVPYFGRPRFPGRCPHCKAVMNASPQFIVHCRPPFCRVYNSPITICWRLKLGRQGCRPGINFGNAIISAL